MEAFIRFNIPIDRIDIYFGLLCRWTTIDEVLKSLEHHTDEIMASEIRWYIGDHTRTNIISRLHELLKILAHDSTLGHSALESATIKWQLVSLMKVYVSKKNKAEKLAELKTYWKLFNYTPRWNSFMTTLPLSDANDPTEHYRYERFETFIAEESAKFTEITWLVLAGNNNS